MRGLLLFAFATAGVSAGPILANAAPADGVRKIVVFKRGYHAAAVRPASLGSGKFLKHLPSINASVAVFENPVDADTLRGDPMILRVDDDVRFNATAQSQPWGIVRVNAPNAWSHSQGTGVNVCILDSGVSLSHPDLAANIKASVNIINPGQSAEDDYGHGSHVAGIVAAVNNSIGVVGVAPQANLFAIKVLDASGSGWLSDIIAGLQWCQQNGGKVANLSLGGSDDITAFHEAITAAFNAGITLVAAVGNGGPCTNCVDYPAKYAEVIAVSASNASDAFGAYSSQGPEVDFIAPGSSIYSTYRGGTYSTMKGTSMATPHVAGLAALKLAQEPGLTPTQVRQALQAAATPLAGISTGQQGSGMIDAHALVGSVSVDATPPTVSITAPADGATVSGVVSVTASASDNVGVSKVEFYADGALQATVMSGPYAFGWNTTSISNSQHVLLAKAYDAAGNMGTSAAVTVTVNNATPDTTPPTVSITAPSDGATVSDSVSVTASASDNIGVTRVEFYVGGILNAVDPSAPYSFTWNTHAVLDGAHSLTARAYDAAGNSETSAAVGVVVSNGSEGDATPPTVSITAPLSGDTVAGIVSVSVSATDNVGVARVEIYVDSALKATALSSPCIYLWDTQTSPNGLHTLAAKAYDAMGNSSQQKIGVNVINASSGTWLISNGLGGVVTDTGTSTTLTFLPNSLPQDSMLIEIQAEDHSDSAAESSKAASATALQLTRARDGVSLSPEGVSFLNPVAVRLAMPSCGGGAAALYSWDHAAGQWRKVSGSFMTADGCQLVALLSHFSTYAVFYEATAGTNVSLGDVYVFPNPVKGSQRPTLHINASAGDSVKIMIFDVTGRLIHQNAVDGAPSPVMRAGATATAYEYAWDMDAFGSGVYYYSVEVSKQGSKSKANGKFVLIR